MSFISADPIDPVALLETFTSRAEGAGAIVSFTGIVRGNGGRERAVARPPPDADRAKHRRDRRRHPCGLRDRRSADRAWIGAIGTGEPVVFVAAASKHRRAAFEAVNHAMDRLKTDAILWKRETSSDGTRWIEARPQDHADRARWEERG